MASPACGRKTLRQETLTREGADRMAQRFIQLADVSEILDISSAQAYALVRSGELTATTEGGRGRTRC